MDSKKVTKEKTCAFYASDYHFEMISLPYIAEKLEEKKDVIILTENNLNNTIETLVTRMNFNNDKKKEILKLNWKNDDLEKFKIINELAKKEEKMVIFVKGKENYIKNINKNIEKWVGDDNAKIINCYDVEEVGEKLNEIINGYNKILSTSGEKDII